jgi:hypothetical protein
MVGKKTENEIFNEDIVKFITENKEMVEKILTAEREKTVAAMESGNISPKEFLEYHGAGARDAISGEKAMVKELAHSQKERAEMLVEGAMSMITNPDFQKHAISAGLEMLLALDSLIKAAPLPEFAKDFAERARSTGDVVQQTYCDMNGSCKAKAKTEVEKVPIKINKKADAE